ncbi:MAG: recombination regulator RecX [Gammaproteobacteria bacterium]|nr:recombination regulator RecX [Gammaproteobacteria bacterium]
MAARMASSAKHVAVRLLSRREHSAEELRQKLTKREFEADEIATALLELKQGDWQSDERYAEAYIRSRRLKGYGPVRIASELRDRGVDELIVDRYLSADDDVWWQAIVREYQKKYHGSQFEDYQEKARRMRFLQYRGFSLDQIHEVVK